MRLMRKIDNILFVICAIIFIYDKDLYFHIGEFIFNTPILLFILGIGSIAVSLTRHPKVWKDYPKWLQCILRTLAFLMGCVIIFVLIRRYY